MIVFILLVHMAALLDEPALAVFSLFAVCVFNLLLSRLGAGSVRRSLVWLLLSLLSGLAVIGTANGTTVLADITLLPPIVINGCFLYLFGRTLRPGREPQITRFRRLVGAAPSQRGELYSKRLTVAWVAFFAVSFAASVLLALYADPVIWSSVVNLGLPLAALVFFFAEHFVRIRYLAHYGSAPISETLRVVLRPDAWSTT